jgi:hypothetical protein
VFEAVVDNKKRKARTRQRCVLGTEDDEGMISPKRAKLSPNHRAVSPNQYPEDDDEDEEDILLGSDPVAEILE